MTALRNPAVQQLGAQIVYRGRDAVGAISRHGRQWLALDIHGRSLGQFPTRLAAFAAVLKDGRDEK